MSGKPKPARGSLICRLVLFALALAFSFWSRAVHAGEKPNLNSSPALDASFIDQTDPQVGGPVVNGLEERRRGPIFAAALRQSVATGKLPPVVIINRDLSVPSTVPDEPKIPAGQTLVRIYLTQWSQTRLGGVADTEILCRFFVEILRDGHVRRKLGPFFARDTFNVDFALPEDRWAQYQSVALKAIDEMAAALRER